LLAARSVAVTSMVTAGLVAVGAATPWAVGVLIFDGPTGWQSLLARWALFLATAVAAVAAVVFGASFVWLARFGDAWAPAVTALTDADHYLTAADFDVPASALLRRAQDAIDAVLSSEVCRAGLLDVAGHGTALAVQEWEIALALREQTTLRQARGQLAAIAADTRARELLDHQQEAARLAEQSIAGRVDALEELAAEARRADDAYRDWRAFAAVSELADRHLDMLASAAADSHAVAEISAMSEQACAVHLALRDLRAR
jgi:hypothetical protein